MPSPPVMHFSQRGLVVVISVLVMLGVALFLLVQNSVKEFRNEEINKHMMWMGNSVIYFCSANYDELARIGDVNDRVQVLLKQAETLQLIEDFVRNNDFKIVVYDRSEKTPFLLLSSFSYGVDTAYRAIELPPYEAKLLTFDQRQYAGIVIPFESWKWQILLLKDSSSYDTLLSRLNIFYLAFGALISMLCFVILLFFRQQVKASEALRQSEIETKSTLDSLAEGVIAVDDKGIIIQINPAAQTITGWQDSDNPVGCHASEVLPFTTSVEGVLIASEAFEEGGKSDLTSHHSKELTLTTKNNSEKLIQVRFANKLQSQKNHQQKSMVLSFHDITEHKAIEEQLRQIQKMESLGQLAGGRWYSS